MDKNSQDMDRKTEYSDASVDDILAEYEQELRAAAAQARYNAILEAEPETETEVSNPPDFHVDEEGVKVYKPKSAPGKSRIQAVRIEEPEEEYAPQEDYSLSGDYSPEYEQDSVREYGGEAQPLSYAPETAYAQDYTESAPYSEDNSEEYSSGGQESYTDPGLFNYYSQTLGMEYPGEEPVLNYYDQAIGSMASESRDEYIPEDYAPEYSPQDYLPEDYAEDYQQDYSQDYPQDYAGEYSQDYPQDYAPEAGEPEAAESPDGIDSRFDIDGKGRDGMYYGAQKLDMSPEEDYVPPEQPEPEPISAEDKAAKLFDFKNKKKRRKKNKKKKPLNAPPAPDFGEDEESYASSFRDYDPETGEYAPESDYAFGEEGAKADKADEFPSFFQYLAGVVTGILFRMKGVPAADGATMEDNDEDLGPELNVKAASKYYGSFVHFMRLRMRVGLVLLLIMAYISLGAPLPGLFKSIQVQAGFCLALQLCIMLLCLDVVTTGFINLAGAHLGLDSMAVILCIFTGIDALAVLVDGFGSPHMPFCLLSSMSLLGVLIASLFSARGLRKALRVPAIGKRSYAVTGETGVKGKEITILKSVRPIKGFVRRSEEAAPDETLFSHISPLIFLVCLLLALIVCLSKHCWGEFLFILTALLAPAVPVTGLLCFALPFFIGSSRIFSSGAAIAGWSGLCDVGGSKNLIVTDRDIFPDGSCEIETIRIFADAPAEKIIAYAGSMITASGSSISSCFGSLMEKNKCSMCRVDNFEYLAGGGMKGLINGESVICGSTDLMKLMNVRVPFRLVKNTSVLLAVNGVLYGIFNMKYTAQPQVREALVSLIRSNRRPIFAIRDFNVTPEMLREAFDLATDGYDFPPYVERFKISEAQPSEGSKIAGVICREGLGPLTHMADTGRSMYIAVKINILITLASVLLGILTVFIKFLTAGFVTAGYLFGFMLLWAVPVILISVFLKF